MATKRNITAGGALTTPMQLGNNDLFNTLSAAFAGGAGSASSSKKSGSRGGGGGGYAAPAAPAVDQTARFTGLFDELLGGTFQPATVSYTAATETELGGQIAAWLLPGYEQAIAERQRLTRGYAAELDADAIARGMGRSTYVTEVKSRQQRDEASDIAVLRSEYGATLAKNVSERLSEERERSLTADMFNAEAEQKAYALAYEAALQLMKLGAVPHKLPDEETGG